MATKTKPPSKKGIVTKGPNKGRFVPKGGSRFAGCVDTQMKKGLSKKAANRLCAFIARKKAGG